MVGPGQGVDVQSLETQGLGVPLKGVIRVPLKGSKRVLEEFRVEGLGVQGSGFGVSEGVGLYDLWGSISVAG